MILLDSNIVIYLRDPAVSQRITDNIANQRLGTCNTIIVEVLGYEGLANEDTEYFNKFFTALKNYLFGGSVTKKTIEIRRSIKIQLPDAIIAATAIENNLTLWTHNSEDFKKVPGLLLFDPLT